MNKTRVLIMEHEERVCRVLSRIIKRMGFEPFSAIDYENFKSLYIKHRPEIILLSLEILDNDNAEFCRYLVEQGSNATIILLSNMDEDDLSSFEKLGLSAGLNMGGILRKPIDVDSVKSKLNNIMQQNRNNLIKKNLQLSEMIPEILTMLHVTDNEVITIQNRRLCDGFS